MKKLVLLDRDGVINQDSQHYIRSVDDFQPIPGSMEAIARLTAAGYLIGVATNQSGVGRGYYTEEQLHAIHEKMQNLVRAAGGRIDAVEYCPHLPDWRCECRKPAPGMLLRLAERLGCALDDVPFVGDRVSDILAARSAGAKPYMILSPMTEQPALLAYPDVPVFRSLSAWVDSFL
ncbi:D-glycero-beta-D-manno-heptose 1,7-bisphosphate 7-phosphatase [Legionella sp. CNM-4043-24]|uniref:D-glycero-beta-D-manno-heptose 1,7-bisphosphate 7-phosphatase n=1 Tax=Legionella sp. CNM-4043-24 TaxID=3421646 RepID=UPI00403AAB5A